MNKKKIVFIMNPISGTMNKAAIPSLIERYLNHDCFDYEIVQTAYAGHAVELATKAKDEGIDIVVAIGGDGTVNEVARAVVHSNTALGIIPCGSGNGLARHLMLPMNVAKAIQIINEAEIHLLDYGIINDVLKGGWQYKPEPYEIRDEHGTTRLKAFLISCANASQYGNNAYIAPQASMSDGLMDIVVMQPFSALEAPQISIDMFNKTLNKNSKIKTFRCKHLHIHRSAPGYIHFDGDPVLTGENIEVVLKEKGIHIIVNAHADKRMRQPNRFQNMATTIFNELTDLSRGINRRSRQIQALNKTIQRKLNL